MDGKTCGSRSYDLAMYFLSDDPKPNAVNPTPLALAIMIAVEKWLGDNPLCSICRDRHPSDDRHPCE